MYTYYVLHIHKQFVTCKYKGDLMINEQICLIIKMKFQVKMSTGHNEEEKEFKLFDPAKQKESDSAIGKTIGVSILYFWFLV